MKVKEMQMKKSKTRWSKEEDEKLKEIYTNSKTSSQEIINILGRSQSAIHKRARILKIKRFQDSNLIDLFESECILKAGFWKDVNTQKKYLEWFASKNNISSIEDWYEVNYTKFPKFIRLYPSRSEMLKFHYPDYDWLEWKFKCAGKKWWYAQENVRKYMNWLGEQLGCAKYEDWYNIPVKYFRNNYGQGLLSSRYRGKRYYQAIIDTFPEYNWDEKLFHIRPGSGIGNSDYWDSRDNLIKRMDELSAIFNYKSNEDWYNVSTKQLFGQIYGQSLLKKFGGIINLLKVYKPEYNWEPWRFKLVPLNYWNKLENQRTYLDWLFNMLCFKELEDWYNVTAKDFKSLYGHGLLTRYHSSPSSIIIKNYPEYDWQREKFSIVMKKQKRLFQIVKTIFPNEEVLWNFKHPELRFSSGYPMEIDIWIPSLQLAIEYQGHQHYIPIQIFGGQKAFEKTVIRDNEKRAACKENGISLLEIDHKWDGSVDFTRETIDNALKEQV